jgi:hypothetical protein
MSQKQTSDRGYSFKKLNHNPTANTTTLADAVSGAIGSSYKTRSFEDAWVLFIANVAKEVTGAKPDAMNSSVINSKWYQESKNILVTIIEENQYVDILGQFEHEFIMNDLAMYDKYYLRCIENVETITKQYITEGIKSYGQFNFGNTNAGTGISVLKLAEKFVEYGIDIQKLYAECYEIDPHVYNLCLIQLHFAKIRFSIHLDNGYDYFEPNCFSKTEPKQFKHIFGNQLTNEFMGFC